MKSCAASLILNGALITSVDSAGLKRPGRQLVNVIGMEPMEESKFVELIFGPPSQICLILLSSKALAILLIPHHRVSRVKTALDLVNSISKLPTVLALRKPIPSLKVLSRPIFAMRLPITPMFFFNARMACPPNSSTTMAAVDRLSKASNVLLISASRKMTALLTCIGAKSCSLCNNEEEN